MLEFWMGGLTGWLLLPKVVPVASADHGGGLVAYGEPSLCSLSGVEVNPGSWATHSCACPTGIDGVAQDLRPASRQR
jgi:hypothetical protein